MIYGKIISAHDAITFEYIGANGKNTPILYEDIDGNLFYVLKYKYLISEDSPIENTLAHFEVFYDRALNVILIDSRDLLHSFKYDEIYVVYVADNSRIKDGTMRFKISPITILDIHSLKDL
jgi:hypothetical protein